MSYDLAFWKGDPRVEARLAYERLADGQELEGVDPVDETAVLAACHAAFASWSVEANLWTFQPDSDGNGPGFDLQLGPYLVTFSCYGLEGEQMNEIIDVMNRLGGEPAARNDEKQAGSNDPTHRPLRRPAALKVASFPHSLAAATPSVLAYTGRRNRQSYPAHVPCSDFPFGSDGNRSGRSKRRPGWAT